MRHDSDLHHHITQASTTSQLFSLRLSYSQEVEAPSAEAWEMQQQRMRAVHDAFMRRAVHLAWTAVESTWDTNPLQSFAVLLFGSAGRHEHTSWSDQDNGLIYTAKQGVPVAVADTFATQVGGSVCQQLEEIGYPPCEGEVLACDTRWRRSLTQWQEEIQQSCENPDFYAVRHLLIVADARVIYGDERLGVQLHEVLHQQLQGHTEMAVRMLSNTLRYKVLVGLMGNLLTEPYGEDAGGIDLKYGAYLPFVNAIRLISLFEGIRATSTLERIARLHASHVITTAQANMWREAFEIIMRYRLETTHKTEAGTFGSRGMLAPTFLTKEVKQQLKHIHRVGLSLQKWIKQRFAPEGER